MFKNKLYKHASRKGRAVILADTTEHSLGKRGNMCYLHGKHHHLSEEGAPGIGSVGLVKKPAH